ncbi:MAG: GNAT family N-acetyltransferase [Caldilineaceae bacterium]
MTQLTIRSYETDAIPALLALTRATLGNHGAVRKTEDFWHWKHHANPFGPSFGLYTWDEETQLATGLRVLLRWQFCRGTGQSLRAVRAVDTATHPGYQRRGIFSTLTRQAIADLSTEGVDLIYNTPNQQSLPGYLKMGWQVVAQWPLYLKLLRPWRMVAKRLRRQPKPAAPAWCDVFTPAILPWAAFYDRYRAQLPPLIAQAEATRRQVGLRTVRTVPYLDWRYGQHPHIHYGVYAERDLTDKVTGFAILRPNLRYGWCETVLTELFLTHPDSQSGCSFLRRMVKQLQSDYVIAHAAAQTNELQMLQQSGFLRVPRQGLIFTIRPLQPFAAQWGEATQWDLTLGDLEIF